jgi:hypothetical protein
MHLVRPSRDETPAEVSFYVAIFRRQGQGELLVSYSSLEGLRDNLGVLPLRNDESVSVYRFESIDASGEHVDPFEWRVG